MGSYSNISNITKLHSVKKISVIAGVKIVTLKMVPRINTNRLDATRNNNCVM